MAGSQTENRGALPDDAGHAGSYTRPENTMVEPAHESDKTGTAGGTRDSTKTQDYGLSFVVLLVLVGTLALLGYCGLRVP